MAALRLQFAFLHIAYIYIKMHIYTGPYVNLKLYSKMLISLISLYRTYTSYSCDYPEFGYSRKNIYKNDIYIYIHIETCVLHAYIEESYSLWYNLVNTRKSPMSNKSI